MKLRAGAGPLILAALAAACAAAPKAIEVVRLLPPGTPPGAGRLGDYEATFAAIVRAFDEALKLPKPDVMLVLFPTRRSFEDGLLEIGYPPRLARSASAFNGIGGARAVLVNAGVVNGFDRARRTRLLAHELVHSLQYQFGGGTRGASEQWLREGFAEWVACRVTAHLGLASLDSLREDVLGILAGARIGLSPAPLDRLVTFPQWVEAQAREEAPLYAQAFLAAELLIELRGVSAVVGYFERFRSTSDYQRAFSEAFGMDRDAFRRLLLRRWHETVALYSTRR